jgi:heme exporter protein D
MTHWPFIVGSYGATALVLVGLVAWLLADERSVTRRLAALGARGIRRRSNESKAPAT